jgi:hypothetical protein
LLVKIHGVCSFQLRDISRVFPPKTNAGMILLEETVISPRNDPQILDFGALGNHAS